MISVREIFKRRVFGLHIKFSTLLLLSLHIILLVLYIHQAARYTRLSYQYQKYTREIKNLRTEKKDLENKIHQERLPEKIKIFALEQKGMVPVSLNQIKRVSL